MEAGMKPPSRAVQLVQEDKERDQRRAMETKKNKERKNHGVFLLRVRHACDQAEVNLGVRATHVIQFQTY